MGWRFFSVRRFSLGFLKLSIIFLSLVESPHRSWAAPDRDRSWTYRDSNWGTNQNFPFGTHQDNILRGNQDDDDAREFAEMATKTIAGIVIFLVLASFIAFLICLCCPICILAKMRQRRRGFVYHTAANGVNTTTQAGETSVSSNHATALARGPASQPSSNLNSGNSPYPVQQSVTVMPAQQQQHPPPYGPNSMGYPVAQGNVPPYPVAPNPMMPMAHTNGLPDLPPPYPGLPRETESVQQQQPPYNPYFDGNDDSGRNPYMPTTAPYPTKN